MSLIPALVQELLKIFVGESPPGWNRVKILQGKLIGSSPPNHAITVVKTQTHPQPDKKLKFRQNVAAFGLSLYKEML